MENQVITLVADMLWLEIEHIGDEAFSFAPLSDEEIAHLAEREMGLIPVCELSPNEVTLVNDDLDLREMYAALHGAEYLEALPDLDQLQALVNADAIETVRAPAQRAA